MCVTQFELMKKGPVGGIHGKDLVIVQIAWSCAKGECKRSLDG